MQWRALGGAERRDPTGWHFRPADPSEVGLAGCAGWVPHLRVPPCATRGFATGWTVDPGRRCVLLLVDGHI